jgi:hypothetical protein
MDTSESDRGFCPGDLVRHDGEFAIVLHVSREYAGPTRVVLETGRTRMVAGCPFPTITACEGDLELIGTVDTEAAFRGSDGHE